MRRATHAVVENVAPARVSILALREKGDMVVWVPIASNCVSILALREKGDKPGIIARSRKVVFQSSPFVRRATRGTTPSAA